MGITGRIIQGLNISKDNYFVYGLFGGFLFLFVILFILNKKLLFPFSSRLFRDKDVETIIKRKNINKKVSLFVSAKPFTKIKEGYLSKFEDTTGEIYGLYDKRLSGQLIIMGFVKLDGDENKFLEIKKYRKIRRRKQLE